jgi:hypothetical protein
LKLGGVAGGEDISSGPHTSISDEGPVQFDRAFLHGREFAVLCIGVRNATEGEKALV